MATRVSLEVADARSRPGFGEDRDGYRMSDCVTNMSTTMSKLSSCTYRRNVLSDARNSYIPKKGKTPYMYSVRLHSAERITSTSFKKELYVVGVRSVASFQIILFYALHVVVNACSHSNLEGIHFHYTSSLSSLSWRNPTFYGTCG